MGILTFEKKVATAIPPPKLFKVFVLESHNFAPKILPHFIKNVEIIQGDGGAGSIKKTTFADGMGIKYLKHKVDVVDEDNFIYNYTAIEGEPWMDTLEKITCETQIVPSPDGGSITKFINKYHPKGDGKLDADVIKKAEENDAGMFKAVEAYFLANPNA